MLAGGLQPPGTGAPQKNIPPPRARNAPGEGVRGWGLSNESLIFCIFGCELYICIIKANCIMSKTAIFIHMVFATKQRKRMLTPQGRKLFFAFFASTLAERKCHVKAIGGHRDHVHILFDLHPTIALSALVKELKAKSTSMNRKSHFIGLFDGWQDGYYAGSLSPSHVDKCVEYINNQEEHHRMRTFMEEAQMMAMKYGFQCHENDWE